MSSTGNNNSADAQFVVEIDGEKHSEHRYFVDAMKAALLLRQSQPNSKIKVRDLHPMIATEDNPGMAA